MGKRIRSSLPFPAFLLLTFCAFAQETAKYPQRSFVSANPSGRTDRFYLNSFTSNSARISMASPTVQSSLGIPGPSLSLTPQKLLFDGRLGSSLIAAQDVSVSTNDTSALTFSASVLPGSGSVVSGSNWLWLVNPPVSGKTPGILRVFTNTDSLTAGIHNGFLSFSAPGASNNPATLPVTLNIRTVPTLQVRPGSLQFSYEKDFTKLTLPQQTLSVFGDNIAFEALATTDSPTNWLVVSANAGTTPADLIVTILPAGLAPGVYNGAIRIISPDAVPGEYCVANVTLTVTGQPNASVSPDSISLQAQRGSREPVSQTLRVYTNGNQVQVSAATSGQAWLSTNVLDGWAGTFDTNGVSILPTPAIIKVSADPTGLSPGTYTGQVSVAPVSNPSASVSVPVTFQVDPSGLIIPQVAGGGAWGTTITLVNTDAVPAPFTIQFRQPDGQPLSIPLEGIGSVHEYSDTIPVGGTRTLQTAGGGPAVAQGWAEVTTQGSIGGAAIFRQSGVMGDSEAAVLAAPPLGRTLRLPYDELDGHQTGVSVLNTGSTPDTLSVTLRDENGVSVAVTSFPLPGYSQKVFMVAQLFPQIANHRGSIEFSCVTAELSGLGLRLSPDGTFTSFQPVVPAADAGTTVTTRTVSQIADGGGWKTTLVLMNPGTQPLPFSLVFRNPDGSPLTLPLLGVFGSVAEYSDTLQVGGIRLIETGGTAATLVQGWAEIVAAQPVAGTVIFGQADQSSAGSEGTVQILPPLTERFVVPFDNSQGFRTAMALLNTNPAYTITAVLRDENGNRLTTQPMDMAANSRQVFFLPDLFPETANIRGSIEFQDARVSALAFRFNPSGSFTAIPPLAK